MADPVKNGNQENSRNPSNDGTPPGKPSGESDQPAKFTMPTANGASAAHKAQTSRIDLKDAAAGAKQDTARIEVPAADAEDKSGPQADDLKKHTMRVQVEQEAAGKQDTSRIDVDAVLEKQEAKEARPVDGEESTAATEPEPAVGVPKTIRIKRPGAPAAAVSPSAAADAVETKDPGAPDDKKSKTSRIELPSETADDHPPTRRKTVRIKRPEVSASSRQLKIMRPAESAETALPTTISGQRKEVESSLGTVCSVLVIAAVLLAAVLVYVLAAQTVAPNLPLPGRVV